MKAIYLDTFAGISGNMFLGALLDAGFPFEVLKQELHKLQLGEYELIYKKVNKLGIEATYFNVLLPEEHEHHHEEQHCHEGHGDHHHEEHAHGEHGHHHHHGEHAHEEHHHSGHVHGHVHHHEHRNLHDIMHIINGSGLSAAIKEKAGSVFKAIAVAEAKVHGKTVEEVHFHEVGAIDTIIDIVGCLLGLEYLQIEKIYTGTVTTGYGFVECAHGLMPVPAPATAELLQQVPQQKGVVEKEMTTPTGAALLKVLAEFAAELPSDFASEQIAYGAGSRDVQIPNVVRMYVGNTAEHGEKIVEASCNIDDASGEVLAYTAAKLLQNKALDAWLEPIIMKKGRPAVKLVFLAEVHDLPALEQIVFAETTTLGIRYHVVERSVLERKFITVATAYGIVKVKCGFYQGKAVSIAPEYADCQAAAQKTQMPLKCVMEAAKKIAEDILHE